MKNIHFILIISLTFVCVDCSSNKKIINKKDIAKIVVNNNVENAIRKLINYRKEDLAITIYEDDVKKMKERYGIKNQKELMDVSHAKLVFDKCIFFSLRESRNDIEYTDVLASSIIEKWKKKNYLENYHFENYNHNPSISLMKMFDFYKSEDLRKYSDSLYNETLRRYKSGKYPDLEDCINNPSIYLN